MVAELPKLILSNGIQFPNLGYGTGMLTDSEQLKKSLDVVIASGYRHIDTAQIYQNEHIIGEYLEDAVKSGKLKREEIFITSKLAPMYFQPEEAENAIKESLRRLKTDYIDCLLMHVPIPFKPVKGLSLAEYMEKFMKGELEHDSTPRIDTWRVLEKFYKAGSLKAIGISNFSVDQIQDLYEKAEIRPMNLQAECHVYLQQQKLQALCKKLNIVMTAHSTLGNPGRTENNRFRYKKENDLEPLQHPLVLELAQKYNKNPAQIILRQTLQRGIAVIPKSTNPDRIKSNREVFDFELTEEEMHKFEEIAEHRIFEEHRIFGTPNS